MKPFEAYTTYLAVKNHFERDGYDYFRYHGKITAKVESFYARKDRFFFEKLARRTDLVDFLVANFLVNDKAYARDLTHEEAEGVYNDWLKRTQSLSYRFEQDLDKIEDLKSILSVKEGQHPELLRMLLSHKVMIETVIVLEALIGFVANWDEKIQDTVIWPSVKRKIRKYRPFLKFDHQKFRNIVMKRYKR